MIRDPDRMSPVLRSMITEDHPPNDLTIRLVPSRTRRWSDGWSPSSSVPLATCPATETGHPKQSVKHNPTRNEYRFQHRCDGRCCSKPGNSKQARFNRKSCVWPKTKSKPCRPRCLLLITKITGAIGKQSGGESRTPKCNVHCTHSGGSLEPYEQVAYADE